MIQPSGPHLIQELNVVVLNNYEALAGGPDWPITSGGVEPIDDPSSPGRPPVWGTGIIGHDPDTGDPITGGTLGTRVPGGPRGGKPKRRKGGTGHPPSKNTLTRATDPASPRRCFAGILQVRITSGNVAWDGQQPAVFGVLCAPYNPPIAVGPTTAFVVRTVDDPPMVGIPAGQIPVGSLISDAIARFLLVHIGTDGYGVVVRDQYAGPGDSCTAGGPTCGGSVGSGDPIGTGLGAIIYPA